MDPASGLEAYKVLGVAGLFIFMYLATIAMFIRHLKSQIGEQDKKNERMIVALENNTMQSAAQTSSNKDVKVALDNNTMQNVVSLAYFRGRDGKGQD